MASHKPLFNAFLPVLAGITLLFSACGGYKVSEFYEPQDNCWSMQDTLSLSFNAEDTTQPWKLVFPLIFTEDYAWSNIYLKLQTTTPGGETSDLSYKFSLMDESGNWYGEPASGGVLCELEVGSGLKFSEMGEYNFRLYHYMRDVDLCGIARTGIALDPLK